MNRMGEANLANIVGDVCALPEEFGRRAVMEAVAAELLALCVDGPRMSETNAAVAAAFTAGCAAGMGPEVRAAS
jgi:hypothetical protein